MNRLYVLPVFLLCISCISFKGELKGLYSYYKKTNELYPDLLVKPDANDLVCGIAVTEKPQVYIVNGNQIRNCMVQSEHAILYFWSPLCSGEFCYAVNVVQRECNKRNIDLYIVSEYYDGNTMQETYNIGHPIFAIDTEYYRSGLCDRYVPKFMADLTGTAVRNIRFIEFKNSTVTRKFDRLEDL